MYFTLIESVRKKDYYIIVCTDKMYDYVGVCKGSFQVIESRVMGLSHAEYLRYLRDVHGALIVDTHQWYPSAYFKNKDDAKEILHLLNTRARKIIQARK